MRRPGYNPVMQKTAAKLVLVVLASLLTAAALSSAQAQYRHRYQREPKPVDHPAPAVPLDKRDHVVAAPAAFAGRPYWLALAQCGGIYFKLNELYTDIAVQARVVKPNPKVNTEYTKRLNEAIDAASAFYDAADHFLTADRGIERVDAVLIYDEQSLAAGNRVKTVSEALAAARSCPALYQACQEAYPKTCSEPLTPIS